MMQPRHARQAVLHLRFSRFRPERARDHGYHRHHAVLLPAVQKGIAHLRGRPRPCRSNASRAARPDTLVGSSPIALAFLTSLLPGRRPSEGLRWRALKFHRTQLPTQAQLGRRPYTRPALTLRPRRLGDASCSSHTTPVMPVAVEGRDRALARSQRVRPLAKAGTAP